jgi:hypothetical protein
VSDRLVFKPVRLPLQRSAFEIADGLPDLCDDRAIRSSMKAHRLDVRIDHAPLARPVLAYGLAAMDVATIHAVGPGDIIGERCSPAWTVLLRGNHGVLRDFTDEEVGLLVDLPTRLIANLDRVASVEASPGTPIFEKGPDRNVRWQAD